MKISIIVLLILSGITFGQAKKIAWFNNTLVSENSENTAFKESVKSLADFSEIEVAVLSGNLTSEGKLSQFEIIKNELVNSKIPYYLLPGEKDLKWSEMGASNFSSVWEEKRFVFQVGRTYFIGIPSYLPFYETGHYSIEDIEWLAGELINIPYDADIFLFLDQAPVPALTDNSFRLVNLLNDRRISSFLLGSSYQGTELTGIADCIVPAELNGQDGGFIINIIECREDSVLIDRYTKNGFSGRIYGKRLPGKMFSARQETALFSKFNSDLIWKTDIKTTVISPVTFWDNRVFSVFFNGIISCFDLNSRFLWNYDTYGDVVSRPVIIDGNLIVGNLQGDVISIDAETGQTIQSTGYDEAVTSPLKAIPNRTTKNVVNHRRGEYAVVFGTSAGSVICFDADTFEEIWRNTDARGLISSDILYSDNRIVFSSADGAVYCLDARDGILIWKWQESLSPNPQYSNYNIATNGNNVFIATVNEVYAIDIQIGRTIWKQKISNCNSVSLTDDKSKVLLTERNGSFYELAASDGKKLNEVSLKQYGSPNPIPALDLEGKYYIALNSGHIIKISNGKAVPVLFNGKAGYNSLTVVKDEFVLASNVDGRFFLFKSKRD